MKLTQEKMQLISLIKKVITQFETDGGKGSGNFGHKGRPGHVGGSGKGEGKSSGSGLREKGKALAAGVKHTGTVVSSSIGKKGKKVESYRVDSKNMETALKGAKLSQSSMSAWRVDSKTAEDFDGSYREMAVTNGGSCYAVKNDGDIVAVCHNNGDDECTGTDLLRMAVQSGGDRLDAFGNLYEFCTKNGFRPVSYCDFDEEHVPEGWKKGRDSKEPVIFFKYTGTPKELIPSYREFIKNKSNRYGSYDDAREARDDTMKEPMSSSEIASRKDSLDNEIAKSIASTRAKIPKSDEGLKKTFEKIIGTIESATDEVPSPQDSEEIKKKKLSNVSTQLQPYARNMYKRCVDNEPEITKDIVEVSKSIGRKMFGLPYRLKDAFDSPKDGHCRIEDKIQENIQESRGEHGRKKPVSYETATEQITDIVRYTQACTTETLTEDFERTKDALESKGYKCVKVKNTWLSYKKTGNPYRGLNCVFVHPSGTSFELQFHTPESIVVKEQQHVYYEETRSTTLPEDRRTSLNAQSMKLAEQLEAPAGIDRIKSFDLRKQRKR